MAGVSGNPAGAAPRATITEILRKAVDPAELAAELCYHAFTKHNLEAVQYIYDRLDGRPKQALDVSTSEDDPRLLAMRQLSDAIDRAAGIDRPPLLPPAQT